MTITASAAAIAHGAMRQRLANARVKAEQVKKNHDTLIAKLEDYDIRMKKVEDRMAVRELERMSEAYGEKLKDLVVLLHQKVWWQIDRAAPELATSPGTFFELEYYGCEDCFKALSDAVGCVGMSMADYGKLVFFFDNRDDMDLYDSDLTKDALELLQYIKDKETPDGDGWGHIRSIVLRNEKCFLGDPRATL